MRIFGQNMIGEEGQKNRMMRSFITCTLDKVKEGIWATHVARMVEMRNA
jgi:hypothetical protein